MYCIQYVYSILIYVDRYVGVHLRISRYMELYRYTCTYNQRPLLEHLPFSFSPSKQSEQVTKAPQLFSSAPSSLSLNTIPNLQSNDRSSSHSASPHLSISSTRLREFQPVYARPTVHPAIHQSIQLSLDHVGLSDYGRSSRLHYKVPCSVSIIGLLLAVPVPALSGLEGVTRRCTITWMLVRKDSRSVQKRFYVVS